MKMIYSLLLLALVHVTAAQSRKFESLKPEDAIRNVFEALSEGDMSKMEQAVTADVRILEHGVVWTMDSLRFYLGKKRPQDFKRQNTFDFFQSEVSGKMAFVSYHNRADIHANNKDRTVKWLESAVLVNEGGQWKVKMLHSTRLE